MTIIIFFKLLKGLSNKPFELSKDYRHLKFLIKTKYIKSIYTLSETSVTGTKPTGKYVLTDIGKSAIFSFLNQTITWGISLAAITISIIALCN